MGLVVLLGLDSDLHLDAMVLALKNDRIPFIRIDPSRVNQRNTAVTVQLSAQGTSATIKTYSGTFHTQEVLGVWCRYALETLNSTCKNDVARFIEEEFFTTFKGALLCIPRHRWINDPFLDARADHKPYQLHVATLHGLRIPESIVSQDQAELIQFAHTNGSCVIKALGDAPLIEARQDGFYGNYTALLNEETLHQGDWNMECPVFLQRFVPKEADIRATVIDDQVFAARLTVVSDGSTPFVDFRNREDIRTSPFEIPRETQAKVLAMLRHLGLRYAACDFSLHQDTLYFLEANVSGNYLWTEIEAHLPITRAIVDALTWSDSDESDRFRPTPAKQHIPL